MAQVRVQGKFRHLNVQIFKTQCLGQGSFGVVYKAQCDLLPCAAKVIRLDVFDTSSSQEAVLKAIEHGFNRMNELRHPNIVQCLGTYRDDVTGLPVLLMEYIHENLTSFLQNNPLQCTQLHLHVDIICDITVALHYLHLNGIVHGNLSTNNVLISPNHQVKLTDIKMLDFSVPNTDLSPSHTASEGSCNSVYMPPEAFDESSIGSDKSDVFSVGVIGVQVVTGCYPEPSPKFQTVKSYAGMVEISIPEIDRRKSHISLIDKAHPLLPILKECLRDKRTERPSSYDLGSRLTGLKECTEYRKSLESSFESSPNHECEVRGNSPVHEEERDLYLHVTELEEERADCNGVHSTSIESEDIGLLCVEDRLQCKERALEVLTSKLEQKTAALVEREAQLVKVKKERFELSTSLQHLQKEVTALKRRNDHLEKELASKEGEIQRLQVHGPTADAKNGTLTHCISAMTWKRGVDAPFAGKLGSATALGNLVCIRVAGSSEIHVCDTANNHEWFLTPPCPVDACSLVTVKNTLTVVGGRIDACVTNLLYSIHLKSFQAVKKQPWREQFPAMLTKRMFSMAVSSGNILAVAGGWNGHQALRTVEILRLDHDPMYWSRVSNLPSPVYSASACICKGKLYVLGGFTQKGPTKAVLSASIHSLLDSTKENVWHRPTSLPTFRSTCVTINDHLLSFGGENDNESLHQESSANDNNRETGAVFEYSSADGEWGMVSEMPVSRCQSCVAVITERNEIMVMGGHSGSTGRTRTVQFASIEL